MNENREKKQLIIFVAIAYGVTFLMGLLIWYGNSREMDVSVFPAAQMMYPAAGVMLAYLLTKEENLPKGFYITFLIFTGIMVAVSFVSLFVPMEIEMLSTMGVTFWSMISNYVLIVGSIVLWIVLLVTKKEKRRAYGLGFFNWKASVFCVVLFLVLYVARAAFTCAISGAMGEFLELFSSAATWINTAALPVNFFLTFILFLGEEYGWRYYLQPLLQKKFGLRAGVVLLGIVWGLWHMPLDFWYYSDTGLTMLMAQLITCVTLGIFFGYAYLKTGNIWVCVALHFLNNNLIPIFSGNYAADVLQNQTVTWGQLPFAFLVNALFFGLFLLAKPYREKKGDEDTLAQ